MEKLNNIGVAVLLVAMCGLAACSGKKDSGGAPLPIEPPDGVNPAQPPAVTAATPLSLKISTKFDLTSFNKSVTFTETGTDTCTASVATPVVTCTAVIPEGRLYYSSITFAFSYLPDNCRLLTFQPYYYKASESATYLPPWMQSVGGDGIDCSGTDTPAGPDCYGGAAPLLVPGFPTYKALIGLPDETDLTTPVGISLEMQSAYSKGFYSNRHSVNDMAPADQTVAHTAAAMGGQGDAYIANTYVDYTFSCRDSWADSEDYIINLNIRDENTDGVGSNDFNFFTWAEL